MTKQEMDGLWALLGIFRKNDPHLLDKKLKAAWLLVLSPFAAADVKSAVAAYFREKSFWPDVSEIATRCPSPPGGQPARTQRASCPEAEKETDLRLRWEALRAERLRLGLPESVSQARENGLDAGSWWDALEQAHLNL